MPNQITTTVRELRQKLFNIDNQQTVASISVEDLRKLLFLVERQDDKLPEISSLTF